MQTRKSHYIKPITNYIKEPSLERIQVDMLDSPKYISFVTIPGCMIKHSHTFKTGSASLVVPKSARLTSITTPPIRTASHDMSVGAAM